MRRTFCLALTLSVALLSLGALAAGLSSTLDYATYRVRGTTPAQLLRDMNRKPLIDPDSGPSYANLTHDHEVTIETSPTGGQCAVSRLDYAWRFVITTPATDESGLSAETRRLWRDLVASFRRHEEQHRAIFLDCGEDFVAAAGRMTAPACRRLEANVRAFLEQQYEACMARQRAFDARDTPRILALPFFRAARAGS